MAYIQGWTGLNAPNICVEDQKNVIIDHKEVIDDTKNPVKPKDTFGITKVACLLMGLCSAMSLTFFITANDYWMDKFRNVSSNSSDANTRTTLQTNFASSISLANSIPNVILMVMTTFAGHKIKNSVKIYAFFIIVFAIFALNAVFVEVNTDNWQTLFFGLTLVSSAIISGTGVVSGVALFSTVSKFPKEYLHIYMMGQGVADVFAAAVRIFMLAVVSSFKTSAVMYFIAGAVLFALTIILYYTSTQQEFYKYYHSDSSDDHKKSIKTLADIYDVFKDVWVLILFLGLILLVPVHTAVTCLVVSEGYGTGTAWGDTYFGPVITFLLSAVASIVGRVVSSTLKKRPSLTFIFIITIGRTTVFPVLIYLCNAKPRHHLPVVFPYDWEYAIFLAGYMFLTGYLINESMVLTVKMTTPEKLDLAFSLVLLSMSILMACVSPLGVLAVNLLYYSPKRTSEATLSFCGKRACNHYPSWDYYDATCWIHNSYAHIYI